jgi:hypothetical protein
MKKMLLNESNEEAICKVERDHVQCSCVGPDFTKEFILETDASKE